MIREHERFVFVVDTEEYAGNFERELCACMTAQIGDCEVGANQIPDARHAIPFAILEWLDEHTLQVADEHGCARPVTIWPTPGWYNDGHGNIARGEGKHPAYLSIGIFFDEVPPPAVVDCLRRRAREFAVKGARFIEPFTVTGFRLLRSWRTSTELPLLDETAAGKDGNG